jgi:hypothetical protein
MNFKNDFIILYINNVIMKKFLILILFIFISIFACKKEPSIEIKDCDCGYITKRWLSDDENYYYLERENDCTKKLDTLWLMVQISGPYNVGDYICDLNVIDSLGYR